MKSLVYTGIGSRSTPDNVIAVMRSIGAGLASNNIVLRSGGAEGADSAFEKGCLSVSGTAEIFLPKAGHGGHRSRLNTVCDAAKKMASQVHPNWEACGHYARLLHARNCYQVFGESLDNPTDLLLCWTPDGCINDSTRTRQSGGTATAICLASRKGIPVINLARAGAIDAFNAWCVENKIDFQIDPRILEPQVQTTMF